MQIKTARSQEELEQVFSIRYQVYVEEEQKFSKENFPDKKMSDEFDYKTGTLNLLMFEQGDAIGTVRLSYASTEYEKLPSDKLYNFDAVRKDHSGLLPASIGMLAIRRLHQNRENFTALMLYLFKLLIDLRLDYYIFTLNHECGRLISRTLGARPLGEKFWSEEVRNYIIPMIMYKVQGSAFVSRVALEEISQNFALIKEIGIQCKKT